MAVSMAVWLCCRHVMAGGGCCVARVHGNGKKPINQCTGLVIVAKTRYVHVGCFQPVYSPEEAPGGWHESA